MLLLFSIKIIFQSNVHPYFVFYYTVISTYIKLDIAFHTFGVNKSGTSCVVWLT